MNQLFREHSSEDIISNCFSVLFLLKVSYSAEAIVTPIHRTSYCITFTSHSISSETFSTCAFIAAISVAAVSLRITEVLTLAAFIHICQKM